MKKINYNIYKAIGLSFVFILFLSSCNKIIDTDINIDPDSPADVPMNLLLPSIEQALGYNMAGNDIVRTTNIWMQQFEGVDRQSYTEARYQLLPTDVNNLWSTFYTAIFMNAKDMINKAEKTEGKESPHNAGVGRVIVATTLGITTDVFGDMPFSEAFRGNENILTPKFDSQESLYDTLNVILDEAIANLSSATNAVDVDGDVVYGGDVSKWKKAAYSIKARHALQLSAKDGATAYTAALAASANGFASNSDDFDVPWETNNHNPLFQFMEQRTDIRMGATLVDMMLATDDPRVPFYVAEDGNGDYRGAVIGSQDNNASAPGEYIAGATTSSIIMSFAELKFIEAEAHLGLGHTAAAQTAFEEAVAASVLKVTGAANSAWLAGNILGTPVTMELIMEQKYIATFGTNQAYADFRRTGLPVLVMPPDAVLAAMPVRFPYPQRELDYNEANVPIVTLSDNLWWDQ